MYFESLVDIRLPTRRSGTQKSILDNELFPQMWMKFHPVSQSKRTSSIKDGVLNFKRDFFSYLSNGQTNGIL